MPIVAFVIASTDAGPMLVNRLDVMQTERGYFGIGASLLTTGASPEAAEIAGVITLLHLCRRHRGDGLVVLDGGANIGTHALAWAKAMHGPGGNWGRVIAVEPQERIFYALCGNIALNNLWNVEAHHAALGETDAVIMIPELDHTKPASFGSLELRPRTDEDIGQSATRERETELVRIDSLVRFGRVDFIKLDIEGMELDALEGAEGVIARCRPLILAERIKCGEEELRAWLEARDYIVHPIGMNFLAVHRDDPINAEMTPPPGHEKGPDAEAPGPV